MSENLSSANTPRCWGKSKLLKKLLLAGEMGSLVAVLQPRGKRNRNALGQIQATKWSDEQWESHFWARINITGSDCWRWMGGRDVLGYGKTVWKDGNRYLSHRLSWILTQGEIPNGTPHVLHHCDNPSCCNPIHLFIGTQADNVHDMDSKGRRRVARGVQKPNAILNENDVRMIRRMREETEMTCWEISRGFCVSQKTISGIVNGHKWRWLA